MKERWVYRSRQFFTALFGKVTGVEMAEAHRVLGPRLYQIFATLPRQYRRHALNVYRRVVEAGCDDRTVWQAALLHDAGKYDRITGRYVTIFHRVAVVLLEAVPGGRRFLRYLSRLRRRHGQAGFILYPFYLSRHHATLGARLAANRGASQELIDLIEGHHRRSGQSGQIAVLQAADDNS